VAWDSGVNEGRSLSLLRAHRVRGGSANLVRGLRL
jgi:hypothetical protein